MIKRIIVATALLLVAAGVQAQNTTAEHKARYERLVAKLGPAGLGVEGVLDKWAQVDSCDLDLLVARFNLYYERSRGYEVRPRPEKRYLGMEPVLALNDTTGAKVYYYQVPVYDEGIFGNGMRNLEKAIKLYPERLDLRILKATALENYELESPDMTTEYLMSLIDEWAAGRRKWEVPGVETISLEHFSGMIQDFCAAFFNLASPQSRECMKTLAERMLRIDKDNPEFLNDLGSYHVVIKDVKKALKYYDKVLKSHPDNYVAIKNSCTIAIQLKDVKLQKKYLPYMVKYGTETESASAKVRLEALQ